MELNHFRQTITNFGVGRMLSLGLFVYFALAAVAMATNPEVEEAPAECGDYLFSSAEEASGPRYRKIGLDGFPISENKPQSKEQSDREPEETYIDAFDHTLVHQVTDVYVPFGGTDLTLSARRNWRPDIWNLASGLRPADLRPDRPFGPGWTTNLTPNIHFVRLEDHSPPPEDCPAKRPQSNYAYVTDENGTTYRFLIMFGGFFFPMPEAQNQQEVIGCSLQINENGFEFKRKYGTTLQFGWESLFYSFPTPRNDESNGTEVHTWAPLLTVKDRYGTLVQYSDHTGLIPGTITCRGRAITITVDGLRISKIRDPRLHEISFNYNNSAGGVLESVTRTDGMGMESITLYEYESAVEADPKQSVHPPNQANFFSYLDLKKITDPNSNSYTFHYEYDKSRQSFNYERNDDGIVAQWYRPGGNPRNVTMVELPDNLGQSTFANNSDISVTLSGPFPQVIGTRKLTVKDAAGNDWTYTFQNPTVLDLSAFEPPESNDPKITPRLILWGRMLVRTPDGSLIADFDKNAGMALKHLKDVTSTAGTSYTYSDSISPLVRFPWLVDFPGAAEQVPFLGYSDPNIQINPDGSTRQFSYDPTWRVRSQMIDEESRITTYIIDPANGNTKEEQVRDENGVLVQHILFEYTDTLFPGFLTKKTIKALDTPPNAAPGEVDLVTKYIPDAYGNVQDEIVAYGTLNLTTHCLYDENNNKRFVTDPRLNTTEFKYDDLNRLKETDFPGTDKKNYFYDPRGNKVREEDERGFSTIWQFDGLNHIEKEARDMNGNLVIDEPADLVTVFKHNALGFKLTQKTPNGDVTDYEPDGLSRVKKMTTPAVVVGNETTERRLVTFYEYKTNSGGIQFERGFQPTLTTDPRGFTKQMEYDARFRLKTQTLQYAKNPNLYAVTQFDYDNVGNRKSETDPLLKITLHKFDGLNREIRTTFHDNTFTQDFYTSTGLKWKHRNERNFFTVTGFDEAGRPTTVTGPAVEGGQPVTITKYDKNGNVERVTNPRLKQWDYVFDDRNRRTHEKLPIVDFIDENGNTVQGTEQNRPQIVTGYDGAGNKISVIDARGASSITHYDRANRPVKVISPAAGVEETNIPLSTTPATENVYDKNGNIEETWIGYGGNADPATPITRVRRTALNSYDALNRLESTTDAKNIVVQNEYDESGNRTAVIDGNIHRTAFEYDGLNRNTKITDATQKSVAFTFDGVNKVKRLDALNQETIYKYDDRHRLETVSYTGRAQDNRTYHYDDTSNLRTVSEPGKGGNADVAYEYDALNRVITETSNEVTHTYHYDLAGNRKQAAYGGTNRILVSEYDALNRLETVTESGRETHYWYDRNGNVRRLELANDQSINKSYDALNGLVALSSPHYVYGYTYDLARNLKRSDENYPGNSGLNRTVINTYDAINRLVEEAITGANPQTTAYVYDDAHNRTHKQSGLTSTDYGYNELNQLTDWHRRTGSGPTFIGTYTYDENGNQVSSSGDPGPGNSVTQTRTFDYENRLLSLNSSEFDGPQHHYSYVYDYRTRRVERTEDGVVTSLVFSGGTSVQERTAGNLDVEYIRGSDYGGGVGGILYTVRQGDPSFTHYNNRGDVVAKSNSAGVLTYEATYESFGGRTAETGSTQDRQKANTKEEDPTGLLNEGFRYRDLRTGVFITRDPANFVDGPNLYAYVHQNPWTKFDPEGLADGVSLFDVLAPVNASVARGGQSPWGGQRAALEHSRNVTQPILKTVTATGYAVVAGPTLVASGAQIAPSGAAIFNTAVTLSHSPAAVATTSALVTGAVVYHDTGDAKAAIGSAAFVGLDAYATGAFGGRGSSGPAKPAVTAKETNQQTEIAVIRVDAKTHPESAAHIQEAQAAGQPSVLTVDRAAAAGRRKEALQGQPVVSGKDRDEYPPAMFAEGGAGASVKPISRSDNRGAGASMGQQARGLADGEKAKIEVVNRHDKE